MFGYVVVNKPELKMKDYDRYRQYYCGLCHALRERYGMKGQLSLSYDSAFAAIILTALYEPNTRYLMKRCAVHPVGKRKYLKNMAVDYVADMNMVLSYYKCLDDWQDDKNYIRLGYGNLIKKEVGRIKRVYGDKVRLIRDRIRRLGQYERSGSTNIDRLSGLFGDIMGELFAVSPKQLVCMQKNAKRMDLADDVCSDSYFAECEDWSGVLRELGFYLGKFIYILDAFDDVADDVKEGRFNPFAEKYKRELAACDNMGRIDNKSLEQWVKQLLMMAAGALARAYERLPITEEVELLRNIIYSGIWSRFFDVSKARHAENGGQNEKPV